MKLTIAEYAANPSYAIELADKYGECAIVGDDGSVRMVICKPMKSEDLTGLQLENERLRRLGNSLCALATTYAQDTGLSEQATLWDAIDSWELEVGK